MLSTRDLILKHIAPGTGAVIALMMFASPLKAVLAIRKSRTLGVSVSPQPLEALCGLQVREELRRPLPNDLPAKPGLQ